MKYLVLVFSVLFAACVEAQQPASATIFISVYLPPPGEDATVNVANTDVCDATTTTSDPSRSTCEQPAQIRYAMDETRRQLNVTITPI